EVELTVKDGPSAHAGAQKNANNIFCLLSNPQPFLRDGAQIDIIANDNLGMKCLSDTFGQRISGQTDIRRDQNFILGINNAGDTDTDADYGARVNLTFEQNFADNIFNL